MAKRKVPTGKVTQSGKDYASSRGKSMNQVRGLTDSDVGDLISVEADNIKLIENAIDQAMARALEKIGLVAEGYAKKLCPVDTGRLRNSITHAIDTGTDSVAIGTNVEYGPVIEFGTSKRDAANGGRGFLRPAAEDHAEKYRKILESELRNG